MRKIEEQIVAAMINNGLDAYRVHSSYLSPDLFSDSRCRRLYERIDSLGRKGVDFDLLKMHHEFKNDHEITAEFLTYLAGQEVSANAIPRHLQTLRDERLRENIGELMMDRNEMSVPEFVDSLRSMLMEYDEHTSPDWDIKEAVSRTLDGIEQRSNGNIEYSTGLNPLDRSMGGLFRKELTIIAARPSTGKSSLAMNIACHLLRKKKRILYIDLESGDQSMLERFLCYFTGIPISSIHFGRMNEKQMAKLVKTAAKLTKTGLVINDRAGMTVGEIYADALHNKADLLIVDYINKVSVPNTNRSRSTELGNVAKGIQDIGKMLNIPVLLLCQLNRGLEGRNDKTPRLSDLRDSGEIEEYADNVVFLHWPFRYDSTLPEDEMVAVIAKQRNGPVGEVDLHWRADRLRFSDPLIEEAKEAARND